MVKSAASKCFFEDLRECVRTALHDTITGTTVMEAKKFEKNRIEHTSQKLLPCELFSWTKAASMKEEVKTLGSAPQR